MFVTTKDTLHTPYNIQYIHIHLIIQPVNDEGEISAVLPLEELWVPHILANAG